jgi:hypothetical protein
LCGARSAPTAAFGGQSNGLPFALFVSFVVKKTPFASVPFVPPVKPLPPSLPLSLGGGHRHVGNDAATQHPGGETLSNSLTNEQIQQLVWRR